MTQNFDNIGETILEIQYTHKFTSAIQSSIPDILGGFFNEYFEIEDGELFFECMFKANSRDFKSTERLGRKIRKNLLNEYEVNLLMLFNDEDGYPFYRLEINKQLEFKSKKEKR